MARAFRSFHPFIVHMVRGAWLDHVVGIAGNRPLIGEQDDLSAFLFGSPRRPLDDYREILREHQGRECFYCGGRVTGAGALDHFIPWSRYPAHLARWRAQNLDDAPALAAAFEQATLRHDARRSRKIAAWAYEQAELAGARVWIEAERFTRLEARWREALGTA